MNNKFERELESPENWDFENAEIRAPVKAPRMVVSVAFRRRDFNIISEHAKHMGKKTSEFIRDAALDKAIGRDSRSQIYGFGSSGSLWLGNNLPTITNVFSTTIERTSNESVFTSS